MLFVIFVAGSAFALSFCVSEAELCGSEVVNVSGCRQQDLGAGAWIHNGEPRATGDRARAGQQDPRG